MKSARLDIEKMKDITPDEVGGLRPGTICKVFQDTLINEPQAIVILEDILPGEEVEWAFTYSEAQYIMSGKVGVTYSVALFDRTVWKKILEAVDVCVFFTGDRVVFNVLSDEPLRHLCFIMPRPRWEKWQVKEELQD